MNKKIFITSFVCAHLLVTPHLHAWQMPKIDGKQVGIVAAVSAVLLVLMGCAWYKHAKKVSVDQPVVQPAGDEHVTVRFTREQWNEASRNFQEKLEALTKQIADLQGAQEQQGRALVDGFEALPSKEQWEEAARCVDGLKAKFDSRDETIGLMLRNYLHVKQELAGMCRLNLELAGRIEDQLGKASVETIFVGLTEKQEALQKKLTELEEDLKGEFVFAKQQRGEDRETLSKNEQVFVAHQEVLDRHTGLIAQWALAVSEDRRKRAAAPTREDLEQFKSQQDVARKNWQRGIEAALLRITSLRNVTVESDPELTRIALAFNKEAVDPALTNTAEKMQLQQIQQEEDLKKFIEEAAQLKKKNKKAKQQQEALAALSVSSTLTDEQTHTPSEHALPKAIAPSPLGAAPSHPLAVFEVSDAPTADDIHQQALAFVGKPLEDLSPAKPPKEGQDFASLSPKFKAQHNLGLSVLLPIAEDAQESAAEADFGRSLTAAQAERLEAVATSPRVNLQALSDEFDEPSPQELTEY